MTPEQKQSIDSRLQRIASVLLLNASFIDNLGLLNGKMGIAIFFYHYARYTDNEIYERYAGQLIDEIYEEINYGTPVDFANGFIGIGWGIEYLVKNGFVEADTDEILGEIDNIIFMSRLLQPILLNNSNDIFGYGLYYLARLQGRENDDNNLNTLYKKETLVLLTDECERILVHKRFLEFNIPILSAGTLSSLAYFLIEMHRLCLFPIKVGKLIQYLPSNFQVGIDNCREYTELDTLRRFAKKLSETSRLSDACLQYENIVRLIDMRIKTIAIDNETLPGSWCKYTWHALLYRYDDSNGNLFPWVDPAFALINDETNWDKRLDQSDKNNMGLDNGLAGLGMALLNETMEELKPRNEIISFFNPLI